MKTKTKYGDTIHSDDTIQMMKEYIFTDVEKLKAFWQNRNAFNTGSWTANLPLLTITLSDYVKSEEYFAHIEGDEEE